MLLEIMGNLAWVMLKGKRENCFGFSFVFVFPSVSYTDNGVVRQLLVTPVFLLALRSLCYLFKNKQTNNRPLMAVLRPSYSCPSFRLKTIDCHRLKAKKVKSLCVQFLPLQMTYCHSVSPPMSETLCPTHFKDGNPSIQGDRSKYSPKEMVPLKNQRSRRISENLPSAKSKDQTSHWTVNPLLFFFLSSLSSNT